MFAPFPKQSQSFVPTMPPHPPQRVSSKEIATLKVGLTKNRRQGRMDQMQCESFGHRNESKSHINDSEQRHQNRLPSSSRSRSASSITTSFTSLKDEKNYANHSRAAKQCVQRVKSLSPISRKMEKRKQNVSPIAFGRSISKERTFAEEKRKQEECLPLCKRAWTASTNILRDPFVQSPNEVREAVRNTYQSPQTKERLTTTTFTRKTPIGNTIKTSTVTYVKDKLLKDSIKNDEKTVRMTVVTKPKSSLSAPVVVKSNMSKSSVCTETKMSPISKKTTKTASNISLARTNSTYSIDSSSSRRRIRNRPVTLKSTAKATAPPVTILTKARKKKNTEPRNVSLTKRCPRKNNVERSIGVSTRTISPVRIGHERSNSFIMIKDDHKARKQIANPNSDSGTKRIRSDTFFQNLFLRSDGKISSSPKALYQNTAIEEGAQFWNTIPRRAHYTNKRPQSFYSAQERAVTGSKFKTLERENARQARSLSPHCNAKPPRTIHFDRISKFDSFYRLSDEDEEEEFGCSGLNYKYEKRSKSEPRSIAYVNKVKINDERESIEMPICAEERPFSPTREIRSPCSRRIHSFRLQNRSEPSRTQDFDSHRRYHSLDSRLAKRRACCVDGDNYENHSETCSYSRLERFKDLNRFYAKVERVGQLERATSSTDLHPIRKENELIDFDVWKQVRDYERAEREMNSLVCKLKKDEKEKNFLFRPKYAEDAKWNPNNESGLRVKEKSVEDLREIFIAKSLEAALDDIKRNRIEAGKDRYKSLWNGHSILDLASNIVVKCSSTEKLQKDENRIGISNNLMSTLSRDQVSKIKNQLTEIYGNNGKSMQKPTPEEYVIDVSEDHNIRPTSLIVRSNSLVGEKDLLKPVLQRQQNRMEKNSKAGSIGSVHETRMTRSVDRYDSIVRRQVRTYSEEEKKKLLLKLGNEIRDKLSERREKILSPRETRGAIAVENTNMPTSSTDKATVSIKHTEQNSIGSQLPVNPIASHDIKTPAKYHENKPFSYTDDAPKIIGKQSKSKQVKAIAEPQSEKIKEKIEYFEHKKDEKAAKTIYLPRDDYSLDEEELIRAVGEKVEARRQQRNENAPKTHFCSSGLSASVSDMKELFGEKESVRNLIEFRSPSPRESDDPSNIEPEPFFRSRSISPICNSMHSTLKKPFRDIAIHQYESAIYKPIRLHSIFAVPPRRYKSDPTLNETKTIYRNQGPSKVVVKSHEAGDVSYITHKFELKKEHEAIWAARSRPRVRRNISPIQRVAFKDPLMPHIDIISKTAALKDAISRSSVTRTTETIDVCSGEVEKIRHKFECQTSPERVSLVGQMYTSSPDVSEIKDISNYLSSTWIAHKYSKPDDNARSATEPEKGPPNHEVKRKKTKRSNSISPPRINAMLKPLYDIFADQNYDPMKHRPTHRYVPVDKRIEAEYLWRRLKQQTIGNVKNAKG